MHTPNRFLVSGSKVRILAHPPMKPNTYREHQRTCEKSARHGVTIGGTAGVFVSGLRRAGSGRRAPSGALHQTRSPCGASFRDPPASHRGVRAEPNRKALKSVLCYRGAGLTLPVTTAS